jgi:hypothetical protein
MEQQHTTLGPIMTGCGLENVDQVHEGLFKAIHGILSVIVGVGKEFVPKQLLLVLGVLFDPVGNDHVVDPLKGIPKDHGRLAHQFQILGHGASPVKFLVGAIPSVLFNECLDFRLIGHGFTSYFPVPADREEAGTLERRSAVLCVTRSSSGSKSGV